MKSLLNLTDGHIEGAAAQIVDHDLLVVLFIHTVSQSKMCIRDRFTAKGLNSYFTAYTKYVKDQVAGRDQWISLQSVVETLSLIHI